MPGWYYFLGGSVRGFQKKYFEPLSLNIRFPQGSGGAECSFFAEGIIEYALNDTFDPCCLQKGGLPCLLDTTPPTVAVLLS